jgi:hypothetical protein
MRPAVMANLYCATQANANSVRTRVENAVLSGAGRVLAEPVTVVVWHRGIFLVNFYCFCPSASDADTLFQGVIDEWTAGPNANRIQPGSWVRRVDSYEDEGLADVIVSEQAKA